MARLLREVEKMDEHLAELELVNTSQSFNPLTIKDSVKLHYDTFLEMSERCCPPLWPALGCPSAISNRSKSELHDPTFSRTVWRMYGGAKGLVMWYYPVGRPPGALSVWGAFGRLQGLAAARGDGRRSALLRAAGRPR
jgi:hypothetical protein